jgi:hypothetical protein
MSSTVSSQAKSHSTILWVILVGLPLLMAVYQFGFDQFDWPKLPALLQMVSGIGWVLTAMVAWLALQAYQVSQLTAKLRNVPVDSINQEQRFGNYEALEQGLAAIKAKLDKTESDKELLRGSLETTQNDVAELSAQAAANKAKLGKTESDKELLRGSLETTQNDVAELSARADNTHQQLMLLVSTVPQQMIIRRGDFETAVGRLEGKIGILEGVVSSNKSETDGAIRDITNEISIHR